MTASVRDATDPAGSDQAARVTLVIPGRNCAGTLRRCLESVIPLAERGELKQIVFVDDGSTDDSSSIAAGVLSASLDPLRFQILAGNGSGPGAARNLGWQAADSELIWFIDSDCVAAADALSKLLPSMNDQLVAGVGGSYTNLHPDSLVATLIHEEILARHRRMPREVNFLGGFNVLYRRSVLEELGGYDESATNGPGAPGAEDCDLSFRAVRMGHQLGFELDSRVGHHHPRYYWSYLKTQARHGRYRVQLYVRNRDRIQGDSYAGITDYIQPPLAMLSLAAIPLFVVPIWGAWIVGTLIVLLLLALSPMACAIAKSNWRLSALFIPFSFFRAYARGSGMTEGVLTGMLFR